MFTQRGTGDGALPNLVVNSHIEVLAPRYRVPYLKWQHLTT